MQRSSVRVVLWIMLSTYLTGGASTGWGADSFGRMLDFARHLDSEGHYRGAILEYKRYLYLVPDAEERDRIEGRLAKMYFRLGKFDEARRTAEPLLNRSTDTVQREELMLLIGRSSWRLGASEDAHRILYYLARRATQKGIRQRAWYFQGWVAISQRDWYHAITAFRRANREGGSVPLALTSNELAEILLRASDREPWAPDRMHWVSSLIPGLGQIWSGRVSRGLLILGGHVGVTLLAIRAIREDQEVDALGLGILGALFYRWNQLDARRQSARWRQAWEHTLIRKLQEASGDVSEENRLSLRSSPFIPLELLQLPSDLRVETIGEPRFGILER